MKSKKNKKKFQKIKSNKSGSVMQENESNFFCGIKIGRIYFLLFVLGVLILFLRSPYSFSTPLLYAEEGTWTGSILTNGFFDTMLHARPDYFAWGLLLPQEAAILLNSLFLEKI